MVLHVMSLIKNLRFSQLNRKPCKPISLELCLLLFLKSFLKFFQMTKSRFNVFSAGMKQNNYHEFYSYKRAFIKKKYFFSTQHNQSPIFQLLSVHTDAYRINKTCRAQYLSAHTQLTLPRRDAQIRSAVWHHHFAEHIQL